MGKKILYLLIIGIILNQFIACGNNVQRVELKETMQKEKTQGEKNLEFV